MLTIKFKLNRLPKEITLRWRKAAQSVSGMMSKFLVVSVFFAHFSAKSYKNFPFGTQTKLCLGLLAKVEVNLK